MRGPGWARDSITRRFALAIAVAAAVTLILRGAFTVIGGQYAQPPLESTGLPEHTASVIRMFDLAPPELRDALAQAASTPLFQVDWYDRDAASGLRDTAGQFTRAPRRLQILAGGWPNTVVFFRADDPAQPAAKLRYDRAAHPDAVFMAAALNDGTWLVLTAPRQLWGISVLGRGAVIIGILIVSIALVSIVGARQLARPINAFAAAARRFGTDPKAPPMPKQGPAEMRAAITAFNAMQSQIQQFVAGQAAVFAAISHDLRTPLTRMRLRGEFIEDRQQQAKLFKDVDEMQAMVDAALTFLRDNAAEETTTRLDLAELLRTLADDYADMGAEVSYSGPDHLPYAGRPAGLRRAFGNLLDNAVKYGKQPAIAVRAIADSVTVTVSDKGPGIPPAALEAVFMPFQRVDPSRNRHTGGMGLGLTAARAGFRAHGGDVVLSNCQEGGLLATVALPLIHCSTQKPSFQPLYLRVCQALAPGHPDVQTCPG